MKDEQQHSNLLTKQITERLFAQQNRQQVAAYCYAILTLLTISIFGLFVIAPAFSTISNLNKKLEDSKNVHDALQKKLTALHNLDIKYQEIQGNLKLVYGAIPESPEIPTLARQMEVICNINNVTLNSFDVQTLDYYPIQQGKDFYSFTFSMEAEGNETSINNLISSVINFNRLVSITSITSGKTRNSNYGVSISGKAYFAKK